MHIDARQLPDNTLIEGDLCIVGTGPAGLSIALEWNNTPYKVILLEAAAFQQNDLIGSVVPFKSDAETCRTRADEPPGNDIIPSSPLAFTISAAPATTGQAIAPLSILSTSKKGIGFRIAAGRLKDKTSIPFMRGPNPFSTSAPTSTIGRGGNKKIPTCTRCYPKIPPSGIKCGSSARLRG